MATLFFPVFLCFLKACHYVEASWNRFWRGYESNPRNVHLLPLVLLEAVITAEVMSDFLQNLVQLDG